MGKGVSRPFFIETHGGLKENHRPEENIDELKKSETRVLQPASFHFEQSDFPEDSGP